MIMEHPQTIKIDNVEYVRKDQCQKLAMSTDGLEYVVTRSRNAGVHTGFLKSHEGQNVTLIQSRRIWAWKGAASLSQIAMEGVKNPANCKFAMVVNEIRLCEVCEVIPCTEEAMFCIQGVPEWKK